MADQVLVSGASFATTLLVARFLGKEELGRYVLAWLATWIVQSFQIALILMPLTTFALREPPETRSTYFGAVFFHQVAFAVLTSLLAYAAAVASVWGAASWQLDAVAAPMAFAIFFGQIADLLRRYYYVLERPAMSFAIDLTRYGVSIVALGSLFLLAPERADIGLVFAISAAGAALGCAVGWLFVRGVTLYGATVRDVLRRHWTYSKWLLASTVVSSAREGFVSLSIGGLLGVAEVGVLRAVQQLVLLINVPLFVLHNTVPAPASRVYGEAGFTGLIQHMRGFAFGYLLLLCTVLLVIGASGEFLLTGLYGAAYAGYGYLVTAYAGVMLVFLFRDFGSIIVRTIEKTDADFYTTLIGAALTFFLFFFFVGEFGLAGAILTDAIAHIAMFLFVGYTLLAQLRKTR